MRAPRKHKLPIGTSYVPITISGEGQQALKTIIEAKPYTRAFPPPGDLEAWRKTHDGAEAANKEKNEAAVEQNAVSVVEATLGGVSVLDIRPNDWRDNGKVLVYIHGGGYVLFSARSTLVSSGPMSRATGLRVI